MTTLNYSLIDVHDVLIQTIVGKQQHLTRLRQELSSGKGLGNRLALIASIHYLEINIDELQRIANDIDGLL